MQGPVEAIYDGAVFRPLTPLSLAPSQLVLLTIQVARSEEIPTEADDEERPWRGVFVVGHPRKALPESQGLAIPESLPRRELVPNMSWHRTGEADD